MSANSELRLGRIGQIGILVQDLDSAVAFYRDKLGVKHLFTAPGMAFFELEGMRLMLGQASLSEQKPPTSTFLYYLVDDIQQAFHTLVERGVTPVEEPELAHRAGGRELWLAQLKDLDSNPVVLMCERAAA